MRTIILIFSILLFMKNHAQNTIFIQNGTVKLAVTIHSAEKIETVILLHGGPGVPDDMVEVVDQLKKNYKKLLIKSSHSSL